MTPTLLILGGTGEAAALAERLAGDDGLRVITSLAGRTRTPRAVPGRVRTGGFGGADGLRAFLEDEGIDMLVDATHPFASRISAHAAQACDDRRVPRLQLRRRPWDECPGDRWIRVASMEEAAASIGGRFTSVFVTTGHKELAVLAAVDGVRFVIRLVEEPGVPLPFDDCTLILARGPYGEEDEKRLLREHGIDLLLSKNSGGDGTYGKISACRALRIPVMMIDQPPPAPGTAVDSVQAARDWVMARLEGTPGDG